MVLIKIVQNALRRSFLMWARNYLQQCSEMEETVVKLQLDSMTVLWKNPQTARSLSRLIILLDGRCRGSSCMTLRDMATLRKE